MTIKLRSGRLGRIRPGHPWIYKEQILKIPHQPGPGSIVSVVDSGNRSIGTGYYNPRSQISVRILSFSGEAIDEKFINGRICRAVEKRAVLKSITNAYRAVFSEADGLPGLIIDLYNDTVVFQILTLGMEQFKPVILESIRQALNPSYIYEKSESPFRKLEGMKDITAWHTSPRTGNVEIFEGPLKFLVDIVKGHKTGFYLDQRKSRLAIAQIARGKKVLDLFSYTGGFAVSAASGGASAVQGVDIKTDWLDLAKENARLNGVSGNTVFTKSDAFSFIRECYNSGEKFDIIIVDPPSFLKTRESIKSASRGYKELNFFAMKSLNAGGILATFSCSHNMPGDIFAGILKQTAAEAKKRFTILKRCRQAEDHPIVQAIPETGYLKGYFLKVDGNEDKKTDS